MKSTKTTKTMIISAAVLLIGAAVAFAHGGPWGGYGGHMMGYGYGMGTGMMGYDQGYGMGPGMMGYGQGYGMGPGMMNGPQGRGPWANLTDEQRTQLDNAREKFFDDTRKLRDEIRDKQYALETEMRKDAPDAAKAASIQKDLSKLEGEFDQKAIQHQLEVRKLLPEGAGVGGFGRGGHGGGRGFGGGYCWR